MFSRVPAIPGISIIITIIISEMIIIWWAVPGGTAMPGQPVAGEKQASIHPAEFQKSV